MIPLYCPICQAAQPMEFNEKHYFWSCPTCGSETWIDEDAIKQLKKRLKALNTRGYTLREEK